jgi:hypothetical protein
MTDHACKPSLDLTFLRSGIIDALGIRGDVGRDLTNTDLIAKVRGLRLDRDDARALLVAAIDAGIGDSDA